MTNCEEDLSYSSTKGRSAFIRSRGLHNQPLRGNLSSTRDEQNKNALKILCKRPEP